LIAAGHRAGLSRAIPLAGTTSRRLPSDRRLPFPAIHRPFSAPPRSGNLAIVRTRIDCVLVPVAEAAQVCRGSCSPYLPTRVSYLGYLLRCAPGGTQREHHPTADPRPYRRDHTKMISLRRDWIGIRGLRHRVDGAVRKFYVARPAIRIAAIAAIALLGLITINLVYQVLRKPTEMFAFISSGFDKAPADTWRHYGSLFREYSTATISPELLAALAQVVGAGNPVARTYWRWQLSWNPLALYRLPSTLVVGQTPER